MAIDKALYTAHATSTGGRTGTTESSDGKIKLQLSTPKELGGDKVKITVDSADDDLGKQTNQIDNFIAVRGEKVATQPKLAGWYPVANPLAGRAKVLLGPSLCRSPLPAALNKDGPAFRTGGGFLPLAACPVGIRDVFLVHPVAPRLVAVIARRFSASHDTTLRQIHRIDIP